MYGYEQGVGTDVGRLRALPPMVCAISGPVPYRMCYTRSPANAVLVLLYVASSLECYDAQCAMTRFGKLLLNRELRAVKKHTQYQVP